MDNSPLAEVQSGTLGNINLNPCDSPTRHSSSVHKLPFEILSHLFELVAGELPTCTAVDKEFTGEAYVKPGRISKPISYSVTPWSPVSSVCRCWRHVAISTPSLWSVIIIRPWSLPPYNRVEKQLERSKDHPIDIRIHLKEYLEYPGPFIPTLFNLLLPQVYRWRTIEMLADTIPEHPEKFVSCRSRGIGPRGRDSPPYMGEILDAISHARIPIASQLTSVVLVSRGVFFSDDRIPHKPFRLFGCSAPCLETVSLTGVDIDWNQAWISSASNLTTLQLNLRNSSCLSWTHLIIILHGAPQLKVFILVGLPSFPVSSNQVISASTESGMVPIKLVELRQLVLSSVTPTVVQLLRRCYIPALQKLTIHPLSRRNDHEADHEALVAQFTTPQFPLATSDLTMQAQLPPSHSLLANVDYLCLDRFPCSAQCVNALYEDLNHLTTLVLQVNLHKNPVYLDLLLTQSGQFPDIKLPHLKNLCIYSITAGSGFWCSVLHVCDLARDRHDVGAPLRTLILRGFGYYEEWQEDESWVWCHRNLESFYVSEYYMVPPLHQSH